jgi:prevent-host-death family protein
LGERAGRRGYDVVTLIEGNYKMSGNMRSVGVRELKARTSAILREVQSTGTEILVTVHGRPIARIEPVPSDREVEPTDGMGGTRGILTGLLNLDWKEFEAAKKLWEPRPLDFE